MMPYHMLIKAHANPVVGTRSIHRSLAIAKAWTDSGGTTTLVCPTIPRRLYHQLNGVGCEVIEADPTQTGIAQVVKLASDKKSSWIVVDDRKLDCQGFNKIKEQLSTRSRCRVLKVNEDPSPEKIPADVVLNLNPLANLSRAFVEKPASTLWMHGSEFPLLSHNLETVSRKSQSKSQANVLVVASDSHVTQRLVEKVMSASPLPNRIEFTCRGEPGWLPALRANFDIEVVGHRNLDRIQSLLNRSDVVVTDDGSWCYDLVARNMPFTIVELNPSQQRDVTATRDAKCVWFSEGWSRSLNNIKSALSANDCVVRPIFDETPILADGCAEMICDQLRKLATDNVQAIKASA